MADVVGLIKTVISGLASLVTVNLTDWYNGTKDREQRERHHREDLEQAKKLQEAQQRALITQAFTQAFLQRRQEAEIYRRNRDLEDYPLGTRGSLNRLLPNDGHPAVLVSEVFTEHPDAFAVSLRPPLTALLAEIETKEGCIHQCSGALHQKTSGALSAIRGKLQALDICASEFYNRPAIVIYHEGGRHSLHSYALLWNFFPLNNYPASITIKVGDFYSDLESSVALRSALERLQSALAGSEEFAKAWQAIHLPVQSVRFVEELIVYSCLSVICAAMDAYRFLHSGQSPVLFKKYIERLSYADRYFPAYAQALLNMKVVASRGIATPALLQSNFFSWLKSELLLFEDSEYQFKAEEQVNGDVSLKVIVGSPFAVLIWIPRDFRNKAPQAFWYDGANLVPYKVPASVWAEQIHLVDIVNVISSDALGGHQ
jgi:hypothetical protein